MTSSYTWHKRPTVSRRSKTFSTASVSSKNCGGRRAQSAWGIGCSSKELKISTRKYDRPCPPPHKPQFQRRQPVAAEMAQAGGRVSVAHPIWTRCMPDDLLDSYTRQFARGAHFPSQHSHSPVLLRKMLQAVRVDASSFRTTTCAPTATAFLRYKNRTKCRLLLNAVNINAADRRRPPKIHLPSLRLLSGRLGGGLLSC